MADNKSVAVKTKKKHTVQYDRWGYFFIAPFFLIYIVFSLIPLLTTFVYSFFEYYRDGLQDIGPNFKVSKYFMSQEEYYRWQIDDSVVALDEMLINYDEGEPVTIEIKDEIISTTN